MKPSSNTFPWEGYASSSQKGGSRDQRGTHELLLDGAFASPSSTYQYQRRLFDIRNDSAGVKDGARNAQRNKDNFELNSSCGAVQKINLFSEDQTKIAPKQSLLIESRAAFINSSEGSRSSGEMSWCKEKSTWRDGSLSDQPSLSAPYCSTPEGSLQAPSSHNPAVHPHYRRTPARPHISASYTPETNVDHAVARTTHVLRRIDPAMNNVLNCSSGNFLLSASLSDWDNVSSKGTESSTSQVDIQNKPENANYKTPLASRLHPFSYANLCLEFSTQLFSCQNNFFARKSFSLPSRLYLLAIIALIIIPVATNALTGPNVCSKQETYTSLVNVSVVKAYRVRTYVFCLSIPPKCSKYKMNYKTAYQTQSQTKTRTVDVCCSGYTRVPAEDRCKAICSQDCIHGVCLKPDLCRCEAGFSGPSCNIRMRACPEGKWGMGCVHDCPCLHEGKCDPLYGNCSCHAGWIGQYCEEKCPQNKYGMDCKDQCRCRNGGTCDHISGACYCPPGWTGPLCEKLCPSGTHGNACSNKCQCQNGGNCDPITGKCNCPPGWTGDVCANPCPIGSWSTNCTEVCDCYNGATCDHVTGRCKCTAGFLGNKCQKECPLGTYGVNCTETCDCKNGATCSHISGRCFCKEGWLGDDCSQSACPANQFGPSCSQMCSCETASTERCHPWTGECECKPGWAGVTCSRACPFYKYGEKCSSSCQCKNGAFCNPINGSCTCAPGYHGTLCEDTCPYGKYGQSCMLECRCANGNGCNHETGKCVCDSGWEGLQCAVTCPDGRYGANCTRECDCLHGGACHPETGECTCGPGHFGDRCEKTCEQGMHGTDCKYHCACVGPNVEGCDPETGKCLCKPGFRGVSCESRCSRGQYGENCNKRCDCKNEGSCHPETGKCICERGWNGADCNTPCRPHKHGVNCNQDCPTCSHGNGTCEHTTGACVCASGWRGPRCERTCIEGYWGINCENACQCRNGGECKPETGECVCLPGWTGANCSQPCAHDFFGYNCLQPCHCRNHASCRGNDGFCECLPGWMGPGCTQTCPEGYYGRQCLFVCNCPSEKFICHPVDGCKCRYGFGGDHCDQPMTSTIVDLEPLPPSPRHSSNAGIIMGLVFLIVLTVIVSLVLYYRRRVKSLKRELAVKYTANPHTTTDRPPKLSREPSLKVPPAPSPPDAAAKARAQRLSLKDQHHFDNPVYAYQPVSKSQPNLADNNGQAGGSGGGAGGSGANGALNTIHNNLHHNHNKDTNNRHWDKLGSFTFDDDASCSVGAGAGPQHYDVPGSSTSRKAWEADSTNPNLYHSIDNLKDNRLVDHVYDEIKQKSPPQQGDPGGEYDRLTYSRPAVTVTPHYYRMPTTLPPAHTILPSTTLTSSPQPRHLPTIPTTITPTVPLPTTICTTNTTTTPFNTIPQLPFLTSSTITPHQLTTSTSHPSASTDPSLTSTNLVGSTSHKTTTTFSQPQPTTSTTISTITSSNNSTMSPEARTSRTPSTDSNSENDVTPPPLPGGHPLGKNFSSSVNKPKISSVKVSNLQPEASEDVYSTPRLNNLDVSLENDQSLMPDTFNNLASNNFPSTNPFRQMGQDRGLPEDNEDDDRTLLSAAADADDSASDTEADTMKIEGV
ncbi:protein draper isoform X3 [Hyalella azteca]|uniref:Protein draper isoform X3 n=1 Tax=Hyalella azteca TaxID=294128 RepID=A0A979FHE5_HYAAZ|nr:protein draper isoform X3 [Hyalella azteca]